MGRGGALWLLPAKVQIKDDLKRLHAPCDAQEVLVPTVQGHKADPMDASGWCDYCEQMRVKYPGSFFSSLNSKDEADREASTRAHNRLSEIEKAYADEDEAMMIRLIKIRESLWT